MKGLRASGHGLRARRAIAALVALALLLLGFVLAQALGAAQTRRAKEDVNRQEVDGSTPLQWAVYNGDVAEAQRLLRAGAKVGQANKYGATPMSLC